MKGSGKRKGNVKININFDEDRVKRLRARHPGWVSSLCMTRNLGGNKSNRSTDATAKFEIFMRCKRFEGEATKMEDLGDEGDKMCKFKETTK